MNKDIRNLVMVLGVGFLSAALVTGWFLYSYGPTGQYQAKNTLVEASTLAELNYNDINPKTNQTDRYQFDKILYTFWDKQKKEQGSLVIPIPTYGTFYSMVINDESIKNPPREIEGLFRSLPPARLAVKVRTESSVEWQKDSKDLVLIEFAEGGDYWRVDLNQENPMREWVYYKHPDIYQKSFNLFIP